MISFKEFTIFTLSIFKRKQVLLAASQRQKVMPAFLKE